MEYLLVNQISPFTLVFPLVFVLVFIIIALISKQRRKKSTNNNRLPPGPRKLPFIGNLHQLFFGSELPHHTLSNLAKRYGPLMLLQLGEIPTLIVSSSEMAELFLKTHDIAFASRPYLIGPAAMTNGNRDIVFAPYGEYWRQLRKICTLQLLSPKRVQSFWPVRVTEFKNLCKWVASHPSGSAINLTERIISAIHDIVIISTVGSKTNDQVRYTSIIGEALMLSSGFSIVDFFPSVRLFGKISGLKKKIEGMYQETERIIFKIIDEHIKSRIAANSQGGDAKREDLLDVLLKLVEEGTIPTFTAKDIVPILQDFVGGAIELSATTVEWAMSELLKKPSILKKAQDEVRQIFDGKGQVVDESHFNELKYLQLVIKETFRLHPPGPLLVPRECREQCTVNGYDIPLKTRLMVNVWAIFRDPKYWKDPESFEPERFLDKDIDYKGKDFNFIPFGAGRRICPGLSMGLANVELPLAMLLYHFDWTLPEGVKPEDVDMTETFGLTSKRKYKLYVVPALKRPLPV